jgi:hypothetical protein
MITKACQGERGRTIARARYVLMILCVTAGIGAYLVGAVPGGAASAQGVAGAATFVGKPDATLLQLMRGVMFPESNVIFAGQMDVSTIPHDVLPAMSTNPLSSVYGGWEAVENSSLALAESAKLLVVPGRACANGKAVPVEKADWVKYASAMHDAALGAYKAAQSKNADEIVNAASAVSDSCAACHNVYRSNRAGLAGRCTVAPPA